MATDLLTDREVAAIFRISWQQVQNRCRAGQWPHLRVGRQYRFTPEHIEQITELCTVTPQPVTSDETWGRKRRRTA
jgi:hypothetical protein